MEEVKASPSPSPSEDEESESAPNADEVEEELAGEQIQDRQPDDLKFDGTSSCVALSCVVLFVSHFLPFSIQKWHWHAQRRALWCQRD